MAVVDDTKTEHKADSATKRQQHECKYPEVMQCHYIVWDFLDVLAKTTDLVVCVITLFSCHFHYDILDFLIFLVPWLEGVIRHPR